MEINNVFIEEFDGSRAITYPEIETKGSLDRKPCDLVEGDSDFNHGIHKVRNYRVHHIETLQPVIYYLRGLIDHETNAGTLIKRYVFSARINLNNFGHVDVLELLDKVIDKIKKL